MYRLVVLLAIIVGSSASTKCSCEGDHGFSNVIYDCLHLKEKDLVAEIWSETFPDELYALTIKNCENLILNITVGETKKCRFRYLTVTNIKRCEIVGGGFSGTSLPSHTHFRDVKQMKVKVPLFGEAKFEEGVLELTNVTVRSLEAGAISPAVSTLKKLSMTGVRVLTAERNALAFRGSCDSTLRIVNSTFYSVDEHFISCNVSYAQVENNVFILIREAGFSLETTTFKSSGNIGFIAENCAVKVYSLNVSMEEINTVRRCTENDLVKEKICLGLSAVGVKEGEEETSWKLRNEKAKKESKEIVKNGTEKMGKVSTLVTRFGKRFLFLWFLAVSMLILMFPIAYFAKIFLCKVIDNAFPLDDKYKRLGNEEYI